MTTPAEVAGRYRIDGRLGAGGMSTVFRAHDRVLERTVAVKLLAEHLAHDDAFVARFRREALAAARLQHPNVVQVYDSGQDAGSGRHYIVMEYVDGPSCADLLRDHGMLDIDEAVEISIDACRGLDYAHRSGVVHRDVKPGNLLRSSATGVTKLADFGIAKAAEQSRITQVGSVLGTAAYLSPEQARGEEAGPQADVYSLGVCAYQMLSGRLPVEYKSITELALKQQSAQIEPISTHRPEIPGALDRAVRACLAADPSARYGSARELADALAAGLRDEETQFTRRLDESEHTQALDLDAEATRPLSRTSIAAPSRPRPSAPRQAPAPAWRPEARRPAPPRRGFPLGRLVATLAILVLAAAITLAVLQSSGQGTEQTPREPTVSEQVDGLKDLIRRNSERVR